ncbi:MAG: DUF255 domain-containing protein [Saprospiraceae bacterium]
MKFWTAEPANRKMPINQSTNYQPPLMHKLLIIMCFGLAATALQAQRQPTTTTNTPKTSLTPAGSQRQPSAQPRTQTGATDRSTGSGQPNTKAKTRTTARGTNPYPAPATQPAPNLNLQTTADRNATPPMTTSQPAKTPATPNAQATKTATTTATAEAAKPTVKVEWLTLEEALERNKTEKRKIYIDVYTDWCGWCKRMDETTFADQRVAAYLNENYYAVKFNAEQQQDIVFNGKTYHFKKVGSRGYHELAAEWLNNRLSYPTSVFLNEDLEVIQPLPTYLDASKFETVITYFGTDSHKRTPWETYEKNYVANRNR